jgi:type II secretory pathway predicted ATPase ExeA
MFKYFGLREDPFRVSPDPRYLFLTPNTQKALVSLAYGVQSRSGILLMTGEVGTGKTTLLQKLLDWLHDNRAATAFLFNTRLTADEFLHCMIADFGIGCPSRSKSDIVIRLNHWLLERLRQGELTVLIVDEAQNLSTEVLEEIRMLANLETATEKLLQIVLSGQPELDEKLRRPELRQLRQRITVCCHTLPLTPQETEGYIARRLSLAGAHGDPIFSPEAIQCVHDYARGIPRVINVLCQHALINALADQERPVPPRLVMEAAQELELEGNELAGLTSAALASATLPGPGGSA